MINMRFNYERQEVMPSLTWLSVLNCRAKVDIWLLIERICNFIGNAFINRRFEYK